MLKQRARVGRVQLMPLPRLQTTRRPHFTSRRRWRVAKLMLRASVGRVQLIDAAAAPADDAAARLDQNKVARREADAARRRRSRAAHATATRSNVWSGLCVPLSSLQRTRRLHFTSRRKWRVVRLMLRAGVGRVQLMPLPHAQICVEWSVCAAVEPTDDAVAALHEQKKVASCEADAARRRRSGEADAIATLRCVWSGLCAARHVMCVGKAAAHVLCLVAPEMSELQRCPGDAAFGVSMVYLSIYIPWA